MFSSNVRFVIRIDSIGFFCEIGKTEASRREGVNFLIVTFDNILFTQFFDIC